MGDTVQDYTEKIPGTKNFSFGVEIEFTDVLLHIVAKQIYKENRHLLDWEIKPEASCHRVEEELVFGKPVINTYGGEVSSPIFYNHSDSFLQIKQMCELLQNQGARVNHLCAGHIHFGADILLADVEIYRNLIKLWLAFEDVIKVFAAGESLGLRSKYYTYANDLKEVVDLEILFDEEIRSLAELLGLLKLTKVKENALNFSNLRFTEEIIGTIEVRIPNGTLNPVIWQNNIAFFAALLAKANELSNEEVLLINRLIYNCYTLGEEEKFETLLEMLNLPLEIKERLRQQFACTGEQIIPNYPSFGQKPRIRV